MGVIKSDQFNFLKTILGRNSLVEPNEQPLFQYQLTENDYHELLLILRQFSQSPSKGDMDMTYCALFCLYASEWFRRDYNGGWTWQPIWDALGYKIGQADRGYVIFKGLADYWSRPVSQYADDRRSLLGSVFREGGLPFRLLSANGNRVQEVFKGILKNIDSARLLGRSTYDLTKTHLDPLPEAFHQDTTIELVADMSEKLIQLVDRHELSSQDEPAMYLDSQFKDWRRLFPIPLDENVGTLFLNNLLLSASKNRVKRRQLEPISCIHTQCDSQSLDFMAFLELAESIRVPVEREQLTSGRVELYVCEGLNPVANLGVAYIRFEDSNAIMSPRSRACEFKRSKIEESLWVVIKHAGQTIHQIEVPDSDIDISVMPIGMTRKDADWQYCGKGSFSKNSEEIKAILPKGAEYDATEAVVSESGCISGFSFVCFSGLLVVNVSGDRYRISNSSDVGFSELVKITGTTSSYKTRTGQPIYLGFPKIESSDAQAQIWVSGARYTPNDSSSAGFGYQTIKLKHADGTTLCHKRLAVLPADFEIVLLPGSNPGEGTVQLSSSEKFVASLDPCEGLSCNQIKVDAQKSFHLKAEGSPPSSVLIRVYANLEAQPISLLLPFPAQGVLAFDKDNKNLPRDLILDDLLGSRMILYPRVNGSQEYLLELISNSRSGSARFEWVHRVSDAPLEISLYELRNYIRELFSINPDDLDATVNIRVGIDANVRTFTVKRYACETVADEYGIGIISHYHDSSVEPIPVIIDLSDPKSRPRPLVAIESEGVGTGYYENVSSGKTTKLIVPAPESPIHFRARLIAAETDVETTTKPSSLYTAVTSFHPKENPEAIQAVINDMAENFEHSGWQYVHDLFQNYQYLPLTTFEVWREIAKNREALALLAFRLENAVPVIDRLQEEFNVLWDWIPVRIWQKAFRQFDAYWSRLNLPEEAKKPIIRSRFEKLSKCIFLFQEELDHLVIDTPSANGLPPISVMQTVVADWYQDLMRTHQENNRWPADYSNELFKWYENLAGDTVKINVCRGYQKSVVCLPIFAAAVVSGQAEMTDIFEDSPKTRFSIRKIAEFDRQWFLPVYQYCLEAHNSKG